MATMFTNEQSIKLMQKYNINKPEIKDYLENKAIEDCKPSRPDANILEMTIQSYLMFVEDYTDTVELHKGNDSSSGEILEDTKSKEYRKVPLPAHNKVLRDKKFPLNTFTCLMASSNKNVGGVKGMEFTNYIYDNKIEEAIEFIYEITGKKYSTRTLNKHLKSIIDSGYNLVDLQNTPNGLVYMLRAEIDGGYYVTIPFVQLKELLLSTNKNALRLFILLKDMCKEDSFTPLDRAYLARGIGLSDKSVKNLDSISTIVKTLAKLGMIEIMETAKKDVVDGKIQVKTVYAYRICSLDQYLERDGKVIIKKKTKKIN